MKIRNKILLTTICTMMASIAAGTIVIQNNKLENSSYKKNESSIALVDVNFFSNQNELNDELQSKYGFDYQAVIQKNADSAELARKFDLSYIDKTSNSVNYPDYYGGKYINDNNDLVIQVVKSSSNLKSKSNLLPSAVSSDESIIIEYVDNSYQDLENVNNKIINYFVQNGENYINLVSNHIDIKNNKVVVELLNNTMNDQEWFKANIVNSDLIDFVRADNIPVNTATYNAGGSFNSGDCSLAYRVKMNGVEGFLTAAHCVSDNQIIPNYGSVIKREDGGSMEVAFIQKLASATITNTIQYGYYPSVSLNTTEIASYPDPYVIGTLVAKSGIATGSTSGTITNGNDSYWKNGVYYTNMVTTSMKGNGGDSGGLVFKPGTTANTTSKLGTAMGVVSIKWAASKDDPNPGNLSFTKATVIKNAWGVTRY